jgi:hypothetical protein
MIRVFLFALVLVIIPSISLGGMFRGNPLDKKSVVQFPTGGCNDNATWQAQLKLVGGEWMDVNLGDTVIHDHDGIAWEKGMSLLWRACCVCKEGATCDDENGTHVERSCVEAGPMPLTYSCPNIYNLSGTPYQADHVARWNAANVASPTPTPVPVLSGPPLGACCSEIGKPWACGQAIENTCLNIIEGGWKWVEGEQCSNELCAGGE